MNELGERIPGRLRALVVEDEWPAREYLVELLLAFTRVDVVAAVATSDEARLALLELRVDVAFVDIHLATSGGARAGLDLVRDFSSVPGAPMFVLATALEQHAVEAWNLEVVDYLLKPFSKERVQACVARLERRCPIRAETVVAPARVVARSRKGLVFLRREEVLAFEASGRLVFVHAVAGRFDVDLSLAAFEASLGHGWLRVHRNWVVQVGCIRALDRSEDGMELRLGDDSSSAPLCVPVSRDRLQSVREALLVGATGIRRS
jgi:two-component system, LytTR family, response regulator LytT